MIFFFIHHACRFGCKIQFFSVLLDRESTIWDMEEKNLHERHQLLKQQLKDRFFLQRHQLVKKHEKVGLPWSPLFGLKCASTFISNSIFCCHRSWNTCSATTNGWSRIWNLGSSRRRAGCRRSSAARQRPVWPSLRRASASTQQSAPAKRGRGSNRWEALKCLPPSLISLPFWLKFVLLQFSLQEEKRQKTERQHQQQKHENQMRELIGQCEGNIRELQQLQVSALWPHPSVPDATVACIFVG